MRLKLLFICVFVLAAGSAAAAITTYVDDRAGIFTPEEEAQLTAIAQEIQRSGRAEYAIVTVQSLGGVPIERYSIDLAQGNLGDTAKDNGLLLVIAVEERQFRFEVGSGLEGDITDAQAGRLGRDYLAPSFREGRYGEGTIAASTAVRDALSGEAPLPAASGYGSIVRSLLTSYFVWFLIFWIIMAILNRRNKGRKRRDEYFDAAMMAALMFGGRGGGGSGGGPGFGGGGFSGGGDTGGW